MDESLRPSERIRQKRDYLLIYKKGRRYKGRCFTLVYLSNELSYSRMGVVVSRKVGNAVERNKIKRWMRALFRTNKNLLENPFDLVFIMKKETLNTKWEDLRQDYFRSLESISR